MYLSPKLQYDGVIGGKDITLDVKLFRPNGTMSTSKTSPPGYSYSYDIKISNGEYSQVLGHWGNETKGHWHEGIYKIELWYNGILLAEKSFEIH